MVTWLDFTACVNDYLKTNLTPDALMEWPSETLELLGAVFESRASS